jgi:hypothetical protein
MITLGFVGTAKNTGKTTTALHMMSLIYASGYRIALTSIGYDGESTDHITGLPKPRYFVEPGTVIATAEGCLNYGSAGYSKPQPTGIKTILGEIMIVTIVSPGNVVLAGPNRKMDVSRLVSQLAEREMQVTFLDGALNRLAAMTEADGLILSTGAAYDQRIPIIARHAQALESLFHFPKFESTPLSNDNHVLCVNKKNERFELPYSSIFDANAAELLAGWLSNEGDSLCYVPGTFAPALFYEMCQNLDDRLQGKQFVFRNPLHLLATGQPELWKESFSYIASKNAQVFYQSLSHLNFMTVNPFYPKYLQKTANYIAEYVDKKELLSSVKESVKGTLVIDIFQPPYPDLLELCNLDHKRKETL